MLRRYQLQRESLGLIPEDYAPAVSFYFWVTLPNQLKMLPITHFRSELYSQNCPSCSWNSNLQAGQSTVSFHRPSSPKFVLQLQLAVSPPKKLSRVISTYYASTLSCKCNIPTLVHQGGVAENTAGRVFGEKFAKRGFMSLGSPPCCLLSHVPRGKSASR